jgi:hypothetical protein
MAIELELKYFFTDHDPLGEWVPEKPSDVYFWVGMAIGEVGVEGTFWFDVIVATPEGVNMHHQGEVLDDFVRTQKRGYPELACFGVKREVKGDVAWFLDLYRCGSEGEELLEAIRVACGVVRLICYVPSLDDESEQWYKINGESEMVVVEPLNDDWDCYLFSE